MTVEALTKTGKKSPFTTFPAYQRLIDLAKKPYDLTAPGALNPERVKHFQATGCGIKLLYGTERIDDQVMEALFSLASQADAIGWMEKMQSGEVINFIEGADSEDRAVLHTAQRDLFDKPNQGKAAKEAAKLAKAEHTKLQKFIKEIDESREFTDIVTVAIGGSDLGPESLFFALEHLSLPNRRAHFISNVDPDNAAYVLEPLNLSKTLVVVISKSGSTIETVTNEALVRSYFKKAGLNPDKHFVSVTGKGSPLDNPKVYRECFYMWDYIGGRYSATSMVGGLLLSFTIGYNNYVELLRGAHEMDLNALEKDPQKNLPLQLALISMWNHNFLGCPTTAVIPYSRGLYRLPAHFQQLDMESNGKHIDRGGNRVEFETGPIIWGEPGTNAQHSFFQLLHQGTQIVPMEIIGFKNSQYGEDIKVEGTTSQQKLLSNMIAQAIALATGQKSDNPNKGFEGNRPNCLIVAEELTPYTMGAIFALYEHKVAFQGFIWYINSFDQEGVQLGKVLAKQVMELFKGGKSSEYPLGAAFIDEIVNND